MFVKVTGGISRAVGVLKPLAERLDCGRGPVRMIGGCRSVEMAFWPDSAIEVRLLRPLSNTRPMLVIELAIEPLRR
jgi:hypothetical protein